MKLNNYTKPWLLKNLILVFSFGILAGRANAGQPDTLFRSDEVIRMELRADFTAIQKDRDADPQEHRGELTYLTPAGETIKFKVRVMTRGNFRLDPSNCSFPPLLLDFKKDEVKNTLFANQDKLKLVTPCQTEEDVINEYLIYKMYNQVTGLSMKVRLVNILYFDTDQNKKIFEKHSFFLEDRERTAERNELTAKDMFATPFDIDEDNFKKLSVFQYLIGNKDWYVSSRKNIVIMQSKDSSSLYAVPYDFDMAGFVNADYSKPAGVPENMLSDKRVYKGVCYSYDELKQVFEFYRELKPQFESVINDQEVISKTGKKQILQYLNDSYRVLEDNELVANKFLNTCETRKDYNLFE
ncbi:MAG: hypothetical protein V1903_06180 [Bacteroidota bacterium]